MIHCGSLETHPSLKNMKHKLEILRGLLCTAVACLILSGCASSHQIVPLPEPSTRTRNSGLARIYAIHERSSGNFAVAEDNKLIGEAGKGGYVGWEREPGTATIVMGALMAIRRLQASPSFILQAGADPGRNRQSQETKKVRHV